MSRFLRQSVAALALMGVVAVPALTVAQDAAPAIQQADDTPTLPLELQDLGLSDVQIGKAKRGGQRLRGTLPEDAGQLRAFMDESGALRGAFLRDDKALPQTLVDTLLPQTIRDQDVFGQFARVHGIISGERMIMVIGTNADGERLHAGFSSDGTLMRFGRGDDGRRNMGPKPQRGDFHGHDRNRGFHDRRNDDRAGPRAAISEEALRDKLDGAGYSQIGQISREGPRISVEATNPEGEPVRVQIDRRGEVVRETAR